MMLDIEIQVVTHNPALKTSRVSKTKASFFPHQVVGMFALPEPKDGGPQCQMLLVGGPMFEVYETPQALRQKLQDLIDGIVEMPSDVPDMRGPEKLTP